MKNKYLYLSICLFSLANIKTSAQLFSQSKVSQAQLYQLNMSQVNRDVQKALLIYYPNFSFAIYDQKNIINKFNISAEKIVTNVEFRSDTLLNGFMYMQFYKKFNDNSPVAFFWGNFKNGLAEGFGYLYTKEENKQPFTKFGPWKNGVFANESETENLIKWGYNNFDYQASFNVPEIKDKSITTLGIAYNWDPINPNLDNQIELDFSVDFVTDTKHTYILEVDKKDFFSDLSVKLVAADDFLRQRYDGYQANLELQNLVDKSLKSIKTGGARDYGNNTRVYVDPWYEYNSKDCRSYSEKVNNPYTSSNDDNSTNSYTTVSISFRKDINSEFIKSNSYTLFRNEYCDGSYSYFVTEDNQTGNKIADIALMAAGLNVKQSFETEEQAIQYFIKDASSGNSELQQYQRTEQDIAQEKYNLKLGTIVDRLKSSPLYVFDPNDMGGGAWYSEYQNAIFVRRTGISEKAKYFKLALNYNSIFNPQGYQNSISGYEISTSFVIGQDPKTKLSKIDKDSLYFENGDVWTRINLNVATPSTKLLSQPRLSVPQPKSGH